MLIILLDSPTRTLLLFWPPPIRWKPNSFFFIPSEQVSSPTLFFGEFVIYTKLVLVVKTLFISLHVQGLYFSFYLLPTSLWSKRIFPSICFPPPEFFSPHTKPKMIYPLLFQHFNVNLKIKAFSKFFNFPWCHLISSHENNFAYCGEANVLSASTYEVVSRCVFEILFGQGKNVRGTYFIPSSCDSTFKTFLQFLCRKDTGMSFSTILFGYCNNSSF